MNPDEKKPPLVSNERLSHVIELARRIAQSEKGFKINPPKMVADDPSILASEQVVERLTGTIWLIRPEGGSEERLTLPELVVMLFNLFAIRDQIVLGKKSGFPDGSITFSLSFDVPKLMSPEIVRSILSQLHIVRPPAKPS
jgi:hypothetical protein